MTSPSARVHWLDGSPPAFTPSGTAFGIPWSQGEIDRTTPLKIRSSSTSLPLQSWPLAYWPDGTLKWSGHALPANLATDSSELIVSPGTPTEPESPVSVTHDGDATIVSTGPFSVRFNAPGSTSLISSIVLNGKTLAQNATLVLHVQNAPDPDLTLVRTGITQFPDVQSMNGKIDTVQVEQEGPVRAVIKMTGKYTATTGGEHADFLPFTLRFYISSGATTLRMVHFFIYDGDQTKDFIKGLGLTFSTPMSDQLHDRHIRFLSSPFPNASASKPDASDSGVAGVWGEAARVVSGLRRDATAPVLNAQFNGTPTPPLNTWPSNVTAGLDDLPAWSDYSLDQLSPSYFSISKRTNASTKANWVSHAGHGTRAAGLGYVGGATNGGVVFGLRDFWQGAPRSLHIRNAAEDVANVTLWAWSPQAPAMDMRHYDTVPHGLDLTYEDVGNPDPTPIGIGRSYEITLQLFSATPSRSDLAKLADVHTRVPQLVSTPKFYASKKLFGGRWDLPDTTRSGAAIIEKQKSDLLDFYIKDIDQRQFYGFWNYGDVMHTYDQTRHEWRYDIGGFAWDNGELGTDLWLWLSFLRTGRADVFRIASALTRHLSETDTHHTGPLAGLGSRHNVSHWGDGAKEARVSGSWLRRPFYFITTDELMGDMMDLTLQADQTIMEWDPLRKVLPPPPPEGPGRLRIGPDWNALAGNWFTKWERTMDNQWLERMKIGMRDIGSFKFGLFTGDGSAVGWNADTAHLVDEGGEGKSSYHLMMLFGGGEFLMEAMDLTVIRDDVPEFDAAWLDFCRLFNGTNDEKIARYGKAFSSGGFQQLYAKLQAYVGQRLNQTELQERAWDFLNGNTTGVYPPAVSVGGTDVLNPIMEIVNLATNDAAHLSLSQYAVLAIAPDLAPNEVWDSQEGDEATIVNFDKNILKLPGDSDLPKQRQRSSGKWKKLLCMS
ncbi:CAZyme family PL26 [Agaricus bisporus var. burnettii]|uniref:CAZyme family PL26 n=1 Tax=Agaricus bisporus var. burnettii TaxID=192524 RepID=A0A8H7C4K9_AGABI|nr:CAZyme family PL26 [Agaricus bisporus var. burnettii]